MTTVSVIIPVHDTEKFLGQCLASVLGQTLTGLEVICIDDGSSDASPALLDEAAACDGRLRVIHFDKNGGVSHARNTGLALATGKYVYFMDSDDWLDADYLEAMYAACESNGLDQAVNFNYVFEQETPLEAAACESEFTIKGAAGFRPSPQIANHARCCTWMRMYRREFLLGSGLSFPEEIAASEDLYFSKIAELLQKNVYTLYGPAYHYRSRPGSLSKRNTFDHIIASRLFYDELRRRGISTTGIKLFYCEPLLTIDSAEKFGIIASFFAEIKPLWPKSLHLYTNFEGYCFHAVTGCRSFEEWCNKYPSGKPMPHYLRSIRKTDKVCCVSGN